MDLAILILAGLAALLSLVAVLLALRKKEGSSAPDAEQFAALLQGQLLPLEQRLTAAMSAQREALDRSISQQLADGTLKTTELLTRLQSDATTRQQEAMRLFGDSQAQRHEALQEILRTTLKESAKRQEEELQANHQALTAFREQQAEQARVQAEKTGEQALQLSRTVTEALAAFSERMDKANATARAELAKALELLSTTQTASREAQTKAFAELQERVAAGLDKMRGENEQKLEKIRLTVEEKLQSTLQERLGESFKIVSDRLEQVHKGLGEMQSLASGVGDLKRVLTNVRSRGTFGEVQLRSLLQDALTPSQYEENIPTRPGSTERVEFAILLPGRDMNDAPVRLPIDAKFPQEDYLRLLDAYERADAAEVEISRKALGVRLLGEAQKIQAKYVEPPHTTDFGLLFVPTEGLYAEALRIDGLTEKMQSQFHVVLAGPTTLLALLNSLKMGFQTLKIQQHSSEVWDILGAVKTEFQKFGASLEAVKKNLQAATNNIDKSQTRSRAMMRALRRVDELEAGESLKLLPELQQEEMFGGEDEEES